MIQTHGSKPTLHLYTWVFGGTNVRDNNIVVDGDDDEEEEDVVVIDVGLGQAPPGHNPDPLCVSPVSSGSGMNLVAALAAERHLRASHEPESGNSRAHRHHRRNRRGDDDSTGNVVQGFVDEIAGGN